MDTRREKSPGRFEERQRLHTGSGRTPINPVNKVCHHPLVFFPFLMFLLLRYADDALLYLSGENT